MTPDHRGAPKNGVPLAINRPPNLFADMAIWNNAFYNSGSFWSGSTPPTQTPAAGSLEFKKTKERFYLLTPYGTEYLDMIIEASGDSGSGPITRTTRYGMVTTLDLEDPDYPDYPEEEIQAKWQLNPDGSWVLWRVKPWGPDSVWFEVRPWLEGPAAADLGGIDMNTNPNEFFAALR